MNIYPLVFSNNSRYRIARHSLFWILWILYYTIFTTISFAEKRPLGQSFLGALTETTISVPMDMAFCYSILYFLLPSFLFKGKYIQMVLLWVSFSFLFVMIFNLYTTYLLPSIRGATGMPALGSDRKIAWIIFKFVCANKYGRRACSRH